MNYRNTDMNNTTTSLAGTERSRATDALIAALAVLSGATAYAQAPAASAGTTTTTSAAQKMEAFEVTGSRIKRIDVETPQPVVRMTEADFKSTGFSTLGDAMRAMPAISGTSLVSTDAGTSFTPGISSFNLRGLGANNTLVLINGRRAAPFASGAFNGFQTVFDLNSIPTAAIESLDVLKDGASAIYGSDAVAGVINITLKKNYTGLTTELSIGNTFGTDSFERSGFLIAGAQAGKMSLVTTFDYSHRNSIYGRDLDYTDESDGRPYGGADQRSTAGPIAGVRGLADRTRFPAGTATFNTPQTAPTLAAAVPGIPLYNFQEEAQLFPETDTLGFYTRSVYEFLPTLRGYLEASFRRSQVRIDAAPSAYVATQEIGTSPTNTGMFPRTNPYNPFGQDIVDMHWRLNELGNRIKESTADTPRFVAGLEGDLPISDWHFDTALLYTKNTVDLIERNYTSDPLVQNAFNGVQINGRTYHLNPFGPNPQELLEYLRVTNPNHDEFEIRSGDISVSGPVFQLPAGLVSLALGAEHRREKFENVGTLLNRDSLIVGGGVGSDTYGARKATSYYAELNIPVLKQLELQLAGRHEDYSDFGTTTKPKVAAVFRPIPEVLIRGSYGESFLAPNLAFLYTTVNVGFSTNTLPDPLRPADPAQQIRQFGGGNRNLKPEETETMYGGIVLQPFARKTGSLFRELSFGVDYFDFQQENLIARLTAAQILANTAAFGNLIVRNPAAPGETIGTISHVVTTWQNLTVSEYKGYDLNMRWVLPRNELGEFRLDLSATYLSNFENTAATGALIDNDGNYNNPLTRGSGTLAWKKGDWAASLFVTYIGKYSILNSGRVGLPDVGSQVVYNPQVAYKGFWNSTLTVGVRNVFDQAPPLDPSDSKLTNENVNLVEPAFWYVRWSKEW
ncbi:MAG TPA: TonB-dependent receptor [Opitutaceae bacterium]